ncbi:hypothetical protein LWI28_001634 [Acer negundo]|uniref:Uncharacterized protein n=1 Tax=Acer negundo TaxID=4023 RepID=A0AAD5J8Z4_ACENE|nr:hypothetical protein LWI28_001634 [Acer negundo]
MSTNIAEAMNNAIKECKELPITGVIDYIRRVLQSWFHDRRTTALKLTTQLTTAADVAIGVKDKKARYLWIYPITFYIEKERGREIVVIVEPPIVVVAARRRCYSPSLMFMSSPLQREVGREEITSPSLPSPSPSTRTSGAVVATASATVLTESTHLILKFALD